MCDLILENQLSCHVYLVFQEILILHIEATMVLLCYIVAMLDLQYK